MMHQGHQPSMVLIAPDTVPEPMPNQDQQIKANTFRPNNLSVGKAVVIPSNFGLAGGPDPTGGWRDHPQMDPYGPTNFDPYNPTFIKTPKVPTGSVTQIPSPGYVLAQQDHPMNEPIGPVIGPAPSGLASLASIVQEVNPFG
jgi:hypothetical protein